MPKLGSDELLKILTNRLDAAIENDPSVTARDPLMDSRHWRDGRPDEPAVRVSTVRAVIKQLRADVRKMEAEAKGKPDPDRLNLGAIGLLEDVLHDLDLETHYLVNLSSTAFHDKLEKRYRVWLSHLKRGEPIPPRRLPRA